VDGREVSAADLDRLTTDFIAYYKDHIADASLPFDGLHAALDTLEQQGFRFAVCTNKLEGLPSCCLQSWK
jgi:phosphoglycolate phosphatase